MIVRPRKQQNGHQENQLDWREGQGYWEEESVEPPAVARIAEDDVDELFNTTTMCCKPAISTLWSIHVNTWQNKYTAYLPILKDNQDKSYNRNILTG